MPNYKLQMSKGQSLFEVIFAIAISAIILTGVVALATTSVRNTGVSKNKTLSATYLGDADEWIRRERDDDWANFSSKVGSTFCIRDTTLPWPTPGVCGANDYISGTNNLKREVSFSYPISGDTKIIQAEITVTWEDAQGTHVERSVNRYTNWKLSTFVTPTPSSVTCASMGGTCCTASQCGIWPQIGMSSDCPASCFAGCNNPPVNFGSPFNGTPDQGKQPLLEKFTGTFSDPDGLRSYSIEWGDGSVPSLNTISGSPITYSLPSDSHIYGSCDASHPCFISWGSPPPPFICDCTAKITVIDNHPTRSCNSTFTDTVRFGTCGFTGEACSVPPDCCSGICTLFGICN